MSDLFATHFLTLPKKIKQDLFKSYFKDYFEMSGRLQTKNPEGPYQENDDWWVFPES